MPRELKPYKVTTIDHPNGKTSLDLFFDRNKNVFFAQIAMERVEDTDVEKAKAKARHLLINAPVYEWEPVIVVHAPDLTERNRYVGARRHRSAEVSVALHFTFERCERARDVLNPTEKNWKDQTVERWFSRQFTEDFEESVKSLLGSDWVKRDREARRKNLNLDMFHVSDGDRVLRYSEDLWRALHRIADAIETAHGQLALLIGSKELELRLLQLTAPQVALLPPVKKR